MSCSLEHDQTINVGCKECPDKDNCQKDGPVITIKWNENLPPPEITPIPKHLMLNWRDIGAGRPPSNQTINIGPKRRRKCIDVPAGVSLEDAMDIYHQGWGHSLAHSIHFFTKHIGLLEVDVELKDAYITHMEKMRSVKNIHFKKEVR